MRNIRHLITLCETPFDQPRELGVEQDGRHIGGSIQEAIDWTQDRLKTTRPLAERTLFSMLADKKINETEQGFAVFGRKDESDDELHKRHRGIRSFGAMGKYRFSRSRWAEQRDKMLHRLHNLKAKGGKLNPRDDAMISDLGDEQDPLISTDVSTDTTDHKEN